jgi:hypothetical protein
MNTKTMLVVTALIVAVAAATMAVKVQPVYAPGGVCSGCASPFAPGQLAPVQEAKNLNSPG